jgi:hypothetical protein
MDFLVNKWQTLVLTMILITWPMMFIIFLLGWGLFRIEASLWARISTFVPLLGWCTYVVVFLEPDGGKFGTWSIGLALMTLAIGIYCYYSYVQTESRVEEKQ